MHEGKGILFSNCKWISPIETNIGILEPVDYSGDITGFIFQYKNQIEKDGPLVRCGDDEVLEQFKVICSFGLKSYFSEHRSQVLKICSPVKSKKPQGSPAKQFIENKVELGKFLNTEGIQDFIEITNKIISVDRKSFKKIISALRSISDSIETIEYNIDLAYSMLVYCLESLSQGASIPPSTWDDWDQKNKNELEKIFKKIPQDISHQLKEALLKEKHFKLQRRFIEFVKTNSEDSFFYEEAFGIQMALRKSHLERAMKNAYQMRSKFVHALQPIEDQIRHPELGKSDVFTFSGEPYLTYSGLFRLTNHVVRNYIFSLPSIEKEAFNYRGDLPGIIKMEMASKYWIWKPESFNPKNANQRLGAFLGQLEENKPVTDLTQVMEKIKIIFMQTSKRQRAPMLCLFWIYNYLLREDLRVKGWEKFVNKHKDYLSELRIENIAVRVFANVELPWNILACIQAFKDYSKLKFKKSNLALSPLSEAIILCAMANKSWMSGCCGGYNWSLNIAISELAGKKDTQTYILSCKTSYRKINIQRLMPWYKDKDKDKD